MWPHHANTGAATKPKPDMSGLGPRGPYRLASSGGGVSSGIGAYRQPTPEEKAKTERYAAMAQREQALQAALAFHHNGGCAPDAVVKTARLFHEWLFGKNAD